MKEPIHCVYSTDNNYCQHAAVSISSLASNNSRHILCVHIIHASITQTNKDNLVALKSVFPNLSMQFYKFDADTYSHFRLDGHITLASYFRLFLPSILPSELDQIIFIDADTIIRADISPLWNTSLNGKLIGAVPDIYMTELDRLQLPSDYIYFNAGVLLVSMKSWRARDLTSKFVSYVEKNSAVLRYHDQDALNAVLFDEVFYLTLDWNFQARTTYQDIARLNINRRDYIAIKRRAGIVHFTTSAKPWFYWPDIPFEAEYFKYLATTAWYGYLQPDKTATAVAKRYLRRFLMTFFPALFKLKQLALKQLRDHRYDR